MRRAILILSLTSVLSTPPLAGCGTGSPPRVVVVRPPPCHLAEDAPPVTDAEPLSSAWRDYYRELVAWAWRVHEQCAGEP